MLFCSQNLLFDCTDAGENHKKLNMFNSRKISLHQTKEREIIFEKLLNQILLFLGGDKDYKYYKSPRVAGTPL